MRWGLLAAALALAGCFGSPAAVGPYRCSDEGRCPGLLRCDDGLCCLPGGEPTCRTLVLEDGTCASGAQVETWYLDKDGDGYGDEASARQACAQPLSVPASAPGASWLLEGGDCNDDDPRIHPGAMELCDQVDNDCNGEVDEGFEQLPYWPDADRDGYGDRNAAPQLRCMPSAGLVENDLDCDDQDPTVHPDAEEVCNGKDDNCNEQVDETFAGMGTPCLATGKKGACQHGTRQCQGGLMVCAAPSTGTPERCNGIDDDCNGVIDEQPGCGGPVNLLTTGVTRGGKALSAAGSCFPFTACAAGMAGTAAQVSGNVVTSGGATRHVVWLENSGGHWDLRKRGLGLRLRLRARVTSGHLWLSGCIQPQIILCGKGGVIARYRPNPATLLVGSDVTLAEQFIPVVGNSEWLPAHVDIDLSEVKRVEILVEASSSTAQVEVTLLSAGFEVRP